VEVRSAFRFALGWVELLWAEWNEGMVFTTCNVYTINRFPIFPNHVRMNWYSNTESILERQTYSDWHTNKLSKDLLAARRILYLLNLPAMHWVTSGTSVQPPLLLRIGVSVSS
jgi:hypothetical protein